MNGMKVCNHCGFWKLLQEILSVECFCQCFSRFSGEAGMGQLSWHCSSALALQ